MDSDGPGARLSSSKSSLATSPITPLSMVSSSTSEGVVLDQEDQDIQSGPDFDSSDCWYGKFIKDTCVMRLRKTNRLFAALTMRVTAGTCPVWTGWC